jgi:hypothetical protein
MTKELTSIAADRIRLYGCIARGLHHSDELLLDAGEVRDGGWTARYGDQEDRLYGAPALAWIVERIGELIRDVEEWRRIYRDAGGSGDEVTSDAEAALAVMFQRLAKAKKLKARKGNRN